MRTPSITWAVSGSSLDMSAPMFVPVRGRTQEHAGHRWPVVGRRGADKFGGKRPGEIVPSRIPRSRSSLQPVAADDPARKIRGDGVVPPGGIRSVDSAGSVTDGIVRELKSRDLFGAVLVPPYTYTAVVPSKSAVL